MARIYGKTSLLILIQIFLHQKTDSYQENKTDSKLRGTSFTATPFETLTVTSNQPATSTSFVKLQELIKKVFSPTSVEESADDTVEQEISGRGNRSSEELSVYTRNHAEPYPKSQKLIEENKLDEMETVAHANPVHLLEEETIDNTQTDVDKLVKAIGDSYRRLKDKDKDHHIVVAYGLKNEHYQTIEEALIKQETEKLNKQLEKLNHLSEQVKQTANLINHKNQLTLDSHSMLEAILKYSKALLTRNRPEINIKMTEESHSDHQHDLFGGWSHWTGWSDCTMACGVHSYKFRHRICLHSDECEGESKERKPCTGLPSCEPGVGSWQVWSHWSACSQSCGVNGIRKKFRDCKLNTGCIGDSEETELCPQAIPCEDQVLVSHLSHLPCSASCGLGIVRNLETGITEPCNTHIACPHTSYWTEWSSWGACTVTCGVGIRARTRSCMTLPGGGTCPDSGIHTETCNIACSIQISENQGDDVIDHYRLPDAQISTVDETGRWSSWSDWTSCSVTCSVGVEIKHRRCRGTCYGSTQLRRPCVKVTCELNNIGYSEKLLEGDSAELECPITDLDTEDVIWVSPDGQKIDKDSQDDRFKLVGNILQITGAKSTSVGTYHCVVTHTATGQIRSGDISLTVATCATSPCKHGGSCEEKTNELVPWLSFTCHCPSGTIGTFCELKLSYSTEFWAVVAIITACSILCLCCTVFALSWKEQKDDHNSHPFGIRKFFNNLFVDSKFKSDDLADENGELRLDVSRPEGEGWIGRLCRLLRCTRRQNPPLLPGQGSAYYTPSGRLAPLDEALNQFGGRDSYYRDAQGLWQEGRGDRSEKEYADMEKDMWSAGPPSTQPSSKYASEGIVFSVGSEITENDEFAADEGAKGGSSESQLDANDNHGSEVSADIDNTNPEESQSDEVTAESD